MANPNYEAARAVNNINHILAKDNWREYMDWLSFLKEDFKACKKEGATKEGILVELKKIQKTDRLVMPNGDIMTNLPI
jgi:hypothetical protein